MGRSLAIALNVMLLIAVAAGGALLYVSADLNGRVAFRQLEEAGAVNPDALAKFHPEYGFTVGDLAYKNSVPRYVMEPSQRSLIAMTAIAAAVCLCNVCMHAFRRSPAATEGR